MAASWHLIKTFIREATEDESYAPVADIATAYAKLRAIQRGHFTVATSADNGGLVQIASKIGETQFNFAIPAGLSQADIMAVAETALELIDGKTVAQARALLVRRKTTAPDFSTFRVT